MPDSSVRILNFDDSVVRQQKFLSLFNPQILDLKDTGPKARIWLDKKTKKYIQERIRASSKSSVTFLGSGDFHHITSLLVEQFDEPIRYQGISESLSFSATIFKAFLNSSLNI